MLRPVRPSCGYRLANLGKEIKVIICFLIVEWIQSIPSPILRKNSNWDNISAWRQARSDEDVTESIKDRNNLRKKSFVI